MKKILSLGMSVMLMVGMLSGCSGGGTDASSEAASTAASTGRTSGETYKVGIVQPMEHPSLNEIRGALEEKLNSLMGDSVEIEYKNAQGDSSNISTICNNFVAAKKDAIVGIATPAATAAIAATEGTDIPVIYCAITNPQNIGLAPAEGSTPIGNYTGTGYGLPVEEILDLAIAVNPDIKTIGFLYDSGEENSVSTLETARKYLDSQGIAYEDMAISSTNDLTMAGNQLISKKVDAVFTPTDNTVASALGPVADLFAEAKIPYYVGADSMVKDGGFATIGINYVDLGQQTAELTQKVLEAGTAETVDVIFIQDYQQYVNEDVAATLGIDINTELFAGAQLVHTGDNE